MQNVMATTLTNRHSCPTLNDLYQTRTDGQTALLPLPALAFATAANQCTECVAGGQMISAERAAVICQCSRRLIYRWVEEGALHFRELPNRTVLICGVTLAAKLEQLEGATELLAR
jgi:hypothetical protein